MNRLGGKTRKIFAERRGYETADMIGHARPLVHENHIRYIVFDPKRAVYRVPRGGRYTAFRDFGKRSERCGSAVNRNAPRSGFARLARRKYIEIAVVIMALGAQKN